LPFPVFGLFDLFDLFYPVIQVVKKLLATSKVDLNAKDYDGWTTLSVATVGGYKDIYRYYSTLGVSIRIQETNKSDL
jgi:hypothetical protein